MVPFWLHIFSHCTVLAFDFSFGILRFFVFFGSQIGGAATRLFLNTYLKEDFSILEVAEFIVSIFSQFPCVAEAFCIEGLFEV